MLITNGPAAKALAWMHWRDLLGARQDFKMSITNALIFQPSGGAVKNGKRKPTFYLFY